MKHRKTPREKKLFQVEKRIEDTMSTLFLGTPYGVLPDEVRIHVLRLPLPKTKRLGDTYALTYRESFAKVPLKVWEKTKKVSEELTGENPDVKVRFNDRDHSISVSMIGTSDLVVSVVVGEFSPWAPDMAVAVATAFSRSRIPTVTSDGPEKDEILMMPPRRRRQRHRQAKKT